LERWYRRLLLGQPSLALELAMVRGEHGELEAQMTIVCPVTAVDAIAATLRSCYRDSRLTAFGAMPRAQARPAPEEAPALHRPDRLP
jgi:hypothetical protein